jgi:hypothetical protein
VIAGLRRGPERDSPIERTTLIKIARDTALEYMQARPSLISAYLIGSVAVNEPMLGEATDIDLVLIDSADPPPREVRRLTDQVVLDIQYRARDEYAGAKNLRVHPWRGPELFEPHFLHDPGHFAELAQATVRGQFHRPENVAARARTFAGWARQALHIGLLPGAEPEAPVTLANLCQALLYAANAVVSLKASPGAGRRLVMKLEAAAGRLGRPDLYQAFMEVLGGPELERSLAERLLVDWSGAFRAGQSYTDELIHPARRTVYERGFQAQIEADRAAEGLWLMLATWNACMRNAPAGSGHGDRWAAFLAYLEMDTPDAFRQRVRQAADYVGLADECVERWAEAENV